MNLLEQYIKKIYSEEDVTDEYIRRVGKAPAERLIKVDVESDCYGNVRREIRTFTKSTWEKAKKNGFFMGQEKK